MHRRREGKAKSVQTGIRRIIFCPGAMESLGSSMDVDEPHLAYNSAIFELHKILASFLRVSDTLPGR